MEYSIPKRNDDPAPVNDARVRRSRAGLRRALLELLQAKPLEQITIRDIADSAGVGYTTYFRHYPSKEALLDDLAADEIERLCDLTLPVYDAADSFSACLALCRYVDGNRPLWSTLLTGGAAGAVRDALLRQGRAASASRAPGWLPEDLGVVLAVSVTVELMTWWLRQPDPLPAARIAEILDRVAISPAEGKRPAASGAAG
jgi:AcrR family transcriptional regulator